MMIPRLSFEALSDALAQWLYCNESLDLFNSRSLCLAY